mmetsp:Transcript_36139/g.94633  ORF Transcript_36139/g.94633 Transcript_36139/m.94633 type:complete len:429 (-) Transcript_36139:206-1492(-)
MARDFSKFTVNQGSRLEASTRQVASARGVTSELPEPTPLPPTRAFTIRPENPLDDSSATLMQVADRNMLSRELSLWTSIREVDLYTKTHPTAPGSFVSFDTTLPRDTATGIIDSHLAKSLGNRAPSKPLPNNQSVVATHEMDLFLKPGSSAQVSKLSRHEHRFAAAVECNNRVVRGVFTSTRNVDREFKDDSAAEGETVGRVLEKDCRPGGEVPKAYEAAFGHPAIADFTQSLGRPGPLPKEKITDWYCPSSESIGVSKNFPVHRGRDFGQRFDGEGEDPFVPGYRISRDKKRNPGYFYDANRDFVLPRSLAASMSPSKSSPRPAGRKPAGDVMAFPKPDPVELDHDADRVLRGKTKGMVELARSTPRDTVLYAAMSPRGPRIASGQRYVGNAVDSYPGPTTYNVAVEEPQLPSFLAVLDPRRRRRWK